MKQHNGFLIAALTMLVISAGLLFAQSTIRNETVVWKYSVGLFGPMPAVEVIGAAATVTADACGGVKRISATAARTTGTTNTFTAPGPANAGCIMRVCNVDDTDAITLDNNALFKSIGGADIILTAFDCTQVFSDGSFWYSTGSLVAN